MKGTMIDFLKLASETPDLSQQLVDLAKKHNFEFSGEVTDKELEVVPDGADADSQTDGEVIWSPPKPSAE